MTLTADASDAVAACLARLDALAAEIAVIRAMLASLANAGPACPAPGLPDDLVPLKVAAHIVSRTPETVRRWTVAHHLGRREGGRWVVSRSLLAAFIAAA